MESRQATSQGDKMTNEIQESIDKHENSDITPVYVCRECESKPPCLSSDSFNGEGVYFGCRDRQEWEFLADLIVVRR